MTMQINLKYEKTSEGRQQAYKAKAEAEKTRRKEIELEMVKAENEYKIDSANKEIEYIKALTRVPTVRQVDVNNICDKIYRSIDGIGTRNTDFEKALDEISKDNVIEIMDTWDVSYGQKYGETFMESVLNDANSRQRNVWGNHILNCLDKRAETYGRDVSPYTNNMRMELKTCFSDPKDLNEDMTKARDVLKGSVPPKLH